MPVKSDPEQTHSERLQKPLWEAGVSFFLCWVIATFFLAKSINLFSFWVPRKLLPSIGVMVPDNAFALITIHHLVQLVVTLALIGMLIHWFHVATWKEFGFSWANWKASIRDACRFVAIWILIQFGVGWYLVSRGFPAVPGFEMNTTNLIGVTLFQLFLSGTGEEPLYRSLILVTLYVAARPVFQEDRRRMAVAVLLSTAVFMFDHINFSIRPLSITHFSLLQQATLLVFGLFYGWLFFKHRTLAGPVVAHGLLNVVIVSSGVVFALYSQAT
jgi:uncharacterized protein